MNQTRERMIAAAARLLAERGYEATSFAGVLQASGAPRGSIYHHFPGGKDDLVATAIAWQADRSTASFDALAGGTPVDIVDGFVGMWRALLLHTDFEAGCSLLGVTVSGSGQELHRQAADAFERWIARLGALLHEAGVPEGDAVPLATTMVAACEGAVAICRAQRSLVPLETVGTHLREAAARHT